jgi:hypothetical protein
MTSSSSTRCRRSSNSLRAAASSPRPGAISMRYTWSGIPRSRSTLLNAAPRFASRTCCKILRCSSVSLSSSIAKLKALLRSAAARTVDVLWRTIGQLLDAFGPTECTNYFAHAGYVPPNRETL